MVLEGGMPVTRLVKLVRGGAEGGTAVGCVGGTAGGAMAWGPVA